MSQIIEEQPVDVAVLGLGVTGGIVSAELSLAGYKVVGIEKGPYWDYANDFSTTKYDEWGVGFLRKFDHPPRISTYTIRNDTGQMALPTRRYTPIQGICMGHGVGGMAQHYGGAHGRYGPWTYQMASETSSRYGAGFLDRVAPLNDIEDWPMTYQEYDPYYVEHEKAFGVTGVNQGSLVPMSQNYPLPPHPTTPVGQAWQDGLEAMGYQPYPAPTSLASQAYVNQYGVQINACVYEGWCGAGCNYVCETGAKANSAYRTVPAAIKSGNFSMALNSYIFRIDVDPSTGLAKDVRYYDSAGNIHVQPAKVIFNGLWGHNIVRLLALSGIGRPYNPTTYTGAVGRGVTYGSGGGPGTASVSGTLSVGANAYSAGNLSGGGTMFFDLSDDNFDHTGLNFIGGYGASGVGLGVYAGSGPANLTGIAGNVSATTAGSAYKATLKDRYLVQKVVTTIGPAGPELPDKRWNVDLDPHFNDIYGDPLARITMDWGANPYNAALYLANTCSQILQKMAASNVTVNKGVSPGTYHVDNWVAHTRGGCRIGSNPATSVWNRYHQSWDVQNFFAGGEITNTTGGITTAGTHPIGASTYVAAEGIKKYLQSPGALV